MSSELLSLSVHGACSKPGKYTAAIAVLVVPAPTWGNYTHQRLSEFPHAVSRELLFLPAFLIFDQFLVIAATKLCFHQVVHLLR